MKSIIVCFILLFVGGLLKVQANPPLAEKELLKKVWKIEQLYFDQIPATVDTTLQKFRLIPAMDSVFYLHDGKAPKLLAWDYSSLDRKISIYNSKSFSDATLFLTYHVEYVDENNLILTLDLKDKNLSVKIIEYRLVPDPNYFNE